MKKIGLSVIIPLYNAKDWIVPTIDHIIDALEPTSFDAEIIIIDDGSSDDGADAARTAQVPKGVKVQVVSQENTGRYLARKHGVELATKDNILFIDSRVYIDKGSLVFLEQKLAKNDDQLWNGHVNIDKKGNPFARFWDAIVCVAWRRYFRRPKTTSYGLKDFDYYPKGTGFFYVPKQKLLAAMSYFEKNTNDLRHSSDDTLLIRYLVKRQNIHLSPEFSCLYHGRSTFKTFFTHAYSRGQFFIDGFFRPGTRFFYPLIAVLLGSIVALASLLLWPIFTLQLLGYLAVFFVVGLLVGSLAMGVSIKDAASLAALGLPFAMVYLVGLWRGVLRKSKILNKCVEWLVRPRLFLRGTALEYLAIFAIFSYIAIAVTDFIALGHLGTSIFTRGPSDATSGFVWLNFVDPSLSLSLSHTDMVNYPTGEQLGSPIYITYLILWLPIRILSYFFGAVAGINIVTLVGYALTATSMYWLTKRLTGVVTISLLAGYALAFFPYAIAKGTAHLAYIFNIFFVALLASFIAFWIKPTKKLAVLFGACIAATFYFDGYFILLSSVMTLGLCVSGVMYGVIAKYSLKEYVVRVKLLLLALLSTLIIIAPIGVVSLMYSEQINSTLGTSRSDIATEIPYYRSWPIDFIVPASDNPHFNKSDDYNALQSYRNVRSDKLSNTSFVGYASLILAAIGMLLIAYNLLARRLKRRSTLDTLQPSVRSTYVLAGCIALVCGVLFLSFMLSPSIVIRGVEIPLPGKLLIQFDISLWRNLSRFSGPLQVVIVAFAMYTLWILLATSKLVGRLSGARRAVLFAVVTALLGFGMFITYASDVNTPSFNLSKQKAGYLWLKEQRDIRVIAELPVVDPIDENSSTYSTMQLVHGKKIVNIKDPRYREQSNVLGSIENSETIDWLYQRGAQAVVVHVAINSKCERVNWGTLSYDNSRERLCVYRINEPKTKDKLFAVIKDGVNPTPNYDAAEKNTARLKSKEVRIQITDAKFKQDTIDSRAMLTATLFNWNVDAPIGGTWRIIQDGKVKGVGIISPVKSIIGVEVERNKDVILQINRVNGANDLLLQNIVVTAR